MQEKTEEKDEEICENINKFVKNPPATQSAGNTPIPNVGPINQQQLMNIINKAGRNHPNPNRAPTFASPNTQTRTVPATGQSTTPTEGGSNNNTLQLSHLRKLLDRHQKQGPAIVDVLDCDELAKSGVFNDQEIIDKVKEYLPEENNTSPVSFRDNVQSAQFKQALEVFQHALRSGELAGVLLSLGMDPSVAGPNTSTEEFFIAFQNMVNERKDRMDTS